MKPVKSNPDAKRNFRPVGDYREALNCFADWDANLESEGRQNEADNGLASPQSARQLVDEYFSFIATKGCTSLPWELVRPAFMWKIKATMDEMQVKEADDRKLADEKKREEFLDNPAISKQKQCILRKASEFMEGAPFTIQRICELLTTPSRHYSSSAKFLRALERTIDVVTEVTETGERITGAPTGWILLEGEPSKAPLENNFIGPVREERVREEAPPHNPDGSGRDAAADDDEDGEANGHEGGA